MAENLNQILWGEGVAFIDGVEAFEVQELSVAFPLEVLEFTKGDGGGKGTIPVGQSYQGRAGFLGMNASIFSKLTGSTTSTGTKKRIRNEKLTKSTDTLTCSQTPIADTLRVVPAGSNKQPLKRVSGSPQVGEYSVSGTTITLNASQPESDFYVSYIYTDSSSGETSQLSPSSLPNSFELYGSLRTKELFSDVKGDVIIYAAKCERTSEFGLGGAIGNVSTPGFDFNIRVDNAGDLEFYWP